MNEGLYEAVFCYGEQKVDPFAQTCVDFDRIIGDMKLVGGTSSFATPTATIEQITIFKFF